MRKFYCLICMIEKEEIEFYYDYFKKKYERMCKICKISRGQYPEDDLPFPEPDDEHNTDL